MSGCHLIDYSLAGLSKDMAIYNFLHEVSSWELYQTYVFDGLEQVQENGHFRRVSIGISKNEFLIFDHRGLMIQKYITTLNVFDVLILVFWLQDFSRRHQTNIVHGVLFQN